MDTTNDNLYDMIAQEILEMSDYYQGRGYTTTDSKDGVIVSVSVSSRDAVDRLFDIVSKYDAPVKFRRDTSGNRVIDVLVF